jgi:hypothetical protein
MIRAIRTLIKHQRNYLLYIVNNGKRKGYGIAGNVKNVSIHSGIGHLNLGYLVVTFRTGVQLFLEAIDCIA